MRVFIANFGRENYEWPTCLERSTIATMNEVTMQPLWAAGDREGYIARTIATRKTAAGETPTRPVASRWFNLMSVIAESSGDTWIHRAKDELWWTVSTAAPPVFSEKVEAIARGERVVVCHKPCQPWSDRNRQGNPLRWNALHPKAKEFLFTEGTLQELNVDNAAYAIALLEGQSLEPWHSRLVWRKKTVSALGKGSSGKTFNGRELAAARMAAQAFATAAASSGQTVSATIKNKDVVGFPSKYELERYLLDLMDSQENLCGITALRMQMDDEADDKEMLPSLDRIDSSGHYERDNLQVVCRFVNRWKGSGDNDEFKRLIGVVRSLRSTTLD